MAGKKFGRSKMRKNRYAIISTLLPLYLLISLVISLNTDFIVANPIYATLIITLLLCIATVTVIILLKFFNDKKRLSYGFDKIDRMNGDEFELYCRAHFKNLGYKVRQVGKGNDFGGDLLITKDGVKTVAQPRRQSSVVGVSAVQECLDAIKNYSADNGMIVTSSTLAPQATSLASKSGVTVYDRDAIDRLFIQGADVDTSEQSSQ